MKNTIRVVILVCISVIRTDATPEVKRTRGLVHTEGPDHVADQQGSGYAPIGSAVSHLNRVGFSGGGSVPQSLNNQGTSYTIDHGKIQEITITRSVPAAPIHAGRIPLENQASFRQKLPVSVHGFPSPSLQGSGHSNQPTSSPKPISISISRPVVIEKSVPLTYQGNPGSSGYDCKVGACGRWVAINENQGNSHGGYVGNDAVNLQSPLVNNLANNHGYSANFSPAGNHNQQTFNGAAIFSAGNGPRFPTANAIHQFPANNHNFIFNQVHGKVPQVSNSGVPSNSFSKNRIIQSSNYNNHPILFNNVPNNNFIQHNKQRNGPVFNNAGNDGFIITDNAYRGGTGEAQKGPFNGIGSQFSVPVPIDNHNIALPIEGLNIPGIGTLNPGYDGGHAYNVDISAILQNGKYNTPLNNGIVFNPYTLITNSVPVAHSQNSGILGAVRNGNQNVAFPVITSHNVGHRGENGNHISNQNQNHNTGYNAGTVKNSNSVLVGGQINNIGIQSGYHNTVPLGNQIYNNHGIGNPNAGITGNLNGFVINIPHNSANNGANLLLNSLQNQGIGNKNIGLISNYINHGYTSTNFRSQNGGHGSPVVQNVHQLQNAGNSGGDSRNHNHIYLANLQESVYDNQILGHRNNLPIPLTNSNQNGVIYGKVKPNSPPAIPNNVPVQGYVHPIGVPLYHQNNQQNILLPFDVIHNTASIPQNGGHKFSHGTVVIASNAGNKNNILAEEIVRNLLFNTALSGGSAGKLQSNANNAGQKNIEIIPNYSSNLNSNNNNVQSILFEQNKNVAFPINDIGAKQLINTGNFGGHINNAFNKNPTGFAKSSVTFFNSGSSGKINGQLTNEGKDKPVSVLFGNGGGNFEISQGDIRTHNAQLTDNYRNIASDIGDFGSISGNFGQKLTVLSDNAGHSNSELGILENIIIATGLANDNHGTAQFASDSKAKQNSESVHKFNNEESSSPSTKNLEVSGVELIIGGSGNNNVVSSTETSQTFVTIQNEQTSPKPEEEERTSQQDYGNKAKISSKIVNRQTAKSKDKKSR